MINTQTLSSYLQTGSRWVFYGFLFLFPLFFLPFTLDPLEINKQSLLLVSVCVSFVLLIGAMLLKKEARVHFGWAQIIPLLLVGAFGVSAFFSLSPYGSWIGMGGTEYTSVLTWIGLSLLFYLCTLFQSELEQKKFLWIILLASASAVGLFGTLSVFGVSVFPFFPTLANTAFNTVGTVNAMVVYLVVMSFYAISLLLTKNEHSRILPKGISRVWVYFLIACLLLETLLLLVVVDYAYLWILVLSGCALLFTFVLFKPKSFPSMGFLFVPIVFTVTSLLFWLLLTSPFSIHRPLEIAPSFRSSTEITNETFRNHNKLIGTGPGTYVMDYAKYHSISVNETDFWNTRFDRASSFVLTLAPTVGYFGMGFFLLFLFFLLCQFVAMIVKQKEEKDWTDHFHVFVPWFLLAVASFLFSFNGTLVIALMLFSGLLAAHAMKKETLLKFSLHKSAALISSGGFVVLLFALFIGIFFTTGRYVAEIAYTKAIRADRAKADTKMIVAELDRAATLNRWNDDYVRNLSAALLIRVTDELKKVSPNAQMSEETKKYVQSLVAASVNASALATTLSPNSVANWLTRGEVYRALTGLVDQSSRFSVVSFKKAIDLEPLNPNHWTELGKTYLSIADALQPLTGAKDIASATKAKNDREVALGEAQKAFTKATELKSNFAPAHYQIALVYEREGKLNEAIGKLESVLKYNDTDVGVAFELGNLYTKRGASGDLEKAKRVFEHVVSLAPSYSDAHWFLSAIYDKLGDRKSAIKEIEAILKLNPDNQIVKTRLEKLRATQPAP